MLLGESEFSSQTRGRTQVSASESAQVKPPDHQEGPSAAAALTLQRVARCRPHRGAQTSDPSGGAEAGALG